MTEEELRAYAKDLILEHATDVEFLTIFELAEEWLPGGDISEKDARTVAGLISSATVTVTFPDGAAR